jgi:hypothetical protein
VGDDLEQFGCLMLTAPLFRSIRNALWARRELEESRAWRNREYTRIAGRRKELYADSSKISKLVDLLNAEILGGNIRSGEEEEVARMQQEYIQHVDANNALVFAFPARKRRLTRNTKRLTTKRWRLRNPPGCYSGPSSKICACSQRLVTSTDRRGSA